MYTYMCIHICTRTHTHTHSFILSIYDICYKSINDTYIYNIHVHVYIMSSCTSYTITGSSQYILSVCERQQDLEICCAKSSIVKKSLQINWLFYSSLWDTLSTLDSQQHRKKLTYHSDRNCAFVLHSSCGSRWRWNCLNEHLQRRRRKRKKGPNLAKRGFVKVCFFFGACGHRHRRKIWGCCASSLT